MIRLKVSDRHGDAVNLSSSVVNRHPGGAGTVSSVALSAPVRQLTGGSIMQQNMTDGFQLVF